MISPSALDPTRLVRTITTSSSPPQLLANRILWHLQILLIVAALLPFGTPRVAAAQNDEISGLTVVPIDPIADPEEVMRLRPFIIGAGATASFSRDANPTPLSEVDGRLRLGEILDAREVMPAKRAEAMARYDDPAVRKIVPAPSLRVALLMMHGWEPYDAVAAAFLDGENPSGKPVERIDFGPTDPSGAVATDVERNGRTTVTVNETYAAEPPEQLMPTLVHESLHGDRNSVEEEITANVLDILAYADVLLAFPDAATAGTELTAFNNATLLALLNSTGRGGPTRLGIEDTLLGDVWLGPYLEEIDATSMRDSVASDEIYDGLPTGGSPGRQSLTTLIARFPDTSSLGPDPAFGEPLLAVIDRGIGRIVPPADAVTLAATLGLDAIGDVAEGPVAVALPADPDAAFAARPFVPADASLFDPRLATVPTGSTGEAAARAILNRALDQARAPDARRATTLRRFADAGFRRLVPAPSLRAAALLLDGVEPWQHSLDAILRGSTRIIFDDLPYAVPVARRQTDNGSPVIVVNQELKNEQPALLASYLVEGTLLPVSSAHHPADPTETVAAALLGIMAYGDLVTHTPGLTVTATPATIDRNRDVLALLNSTGRGEARERFGFLGTSAGIDDLLPGLYADATSFSGYLDEERRLTDRSDVTSRFTGSPLWDGYLAVAGITRDPGHQRSGDETLSLLDSHLAALLPPDEVDAIARSLDLGVAGPASPPVSTAP